MKILNIEFNAFGSADIKEAFLAEGHTYVDFFFDKEETRHNPKEEERLSLTLHRETPDLVFSFNYFPLISKVCQQEKIKYVSWVYDCPLVNLYSYTILNPCNVVYVFDKELYMEFHRAGIATIHYLPLAANTERLDAIKCRDGQPFLYDVSFVGSLYTESHNFFDRMGDLSDYAKGYLDGLMICQRNVQGYNFVQECIEPVLEELSQALPMEPNADGAETKEFLFAQYVINRKITGLERPALLSAIARNHVVDLFTVDESFSVPNLRNHGRVEPYEQAQRVYKQSKINLNITLRSIKSGIPLRCMDIMGSGGFLLTNFQGDFLDFFVPGEDFVYYENTQDLLEKIDYYLGHDQEREMIARSGHDKVAAGHTFRHRVAEMFDF